MADLHEYRVNVDGLFFDTEDNWYRTCHGQYTIKAPRPQAAWRGAAIALRDECMTRHGDEPNNIRIRDWALLPDRKAS